MPEIEKTSEEAWFVLTVAPQHEIVVEQRLTAKGFGASAPVYRTRRRWSDRIKLISVPLFPGYVFCRFAADHRIPVLNTPGVRGAVSFSGQLAPLQDVEVERIQRMAASGLQLDPLDGLRSGARVKILAGPLHGMEATLSHINGSARVVVNVELLNRSVAVQVDADAIAPVNPAVLAASD
jgi:transcription termination/antitermination protein NusG